jgi:hypothetical protein
MMESASKSVHLCVDDATGFVATDDDIFTLTILVAEPAFKALSARNRSADEQRDIQQKDQSRFHYFSS